MGKISKICEAIEITAEIASNPELFCAIFFVLGAFGLLFREWLASDFTNMWQPCNRKWRQGETVDDEWVYFNIVHVTVIIDVSQYSVFWVNKTAMFNVNRLWKQQKNERIYRSISVSRTLPGCTIPFFFVPLSLMSVVSRSATFLHSFRYRALSLPAKFASWNENSNRRIRAWHQPSQIRYNWGSNKMRKCDIHTTHQPTGHLFTQTLESLPNLRMRHRPSA